MQFRTKDLPHYTIICFSTAWCSYTSSEFLSQMIAYHLAVTAALLLSVLAHIYLVRALRQLKLRRIDAHILVALLMSGVITFFDISGVATIQQNDTVKPVAEKYEKQIAGVQAQLAELSKVMAQDSRTKKGNMNWGVVSIIEKASGQAEGLKAELATLRAERDTALKAATATAEGLNFAGNGFSVAMLLLSGLVSTLIGGKERPQVTEVALQHTEETEAVTDAVTKILEAAKKVDGTEESTVTDTVTTPAAIGFQPNKMQVDGYHITCQHCGTETVKSRPTAKFCSDKCRAKNHKKQL